MLKKLGNLWSESRLNQEPAKLILIPFGTIWYSNLGMRRYELKKSNKGRWHLFAAIGCFRLLITLPKSWREFIAVAEKY